MLEYDSAWLLRVRNLLLPIRWFGFYRFIGVCRFLSRCRGRSDGIFGHPTIIAHISFAPQFWIKDDIRGVISFTAITRSQDASWHLYLRERYTASRKTVLSFCLDE
jgi:hypothetical protein